MTIDEHIFLTSTLRNVRDEVQDLARRDANLRAYVTDLEECFAVLYRQAVRDDAGPAAANSGSRLRTKETT
jgi:hypothetical protein